MKQGRQREPDTSEPVQGLLRVGQTALKMLSECSFTTRKLRVLKHFRLVWL
jgi:hypothetical protein